MDVLGTIYNQLLYGGLVIMPLVLKIFLIALPILLLATYIKIKRDNKK